MENISMEWIDSLYNMMKLMNGEDSLVKKVEFCTINGKEFSPSLNRILLNNNDLKKIFLWWEDIKNQIIDNEIPFIFSHAIIICKMENNLDEMIEYEVKGNSLLVTYGFNNRVSVKLQYNVHTFELISNPKFNHQLKHGKEFDKFLYVFKTTNMAKTISNRIKFVMWYITSFQNVVDIKEEDIQHEHEKIKNVSKSRNKHKNINKNVKLIRTVYTVNNIPIDKLKYKSDSIIKRTRKTCEYQFSRKGHWCYSHKNPEKKWWKSESIVGKDKPKKSEGKNYIV